MDRNLRRLQRIVAADPTDLGTVMQYVAALERAVGGLETADHPYLNDADMASAWIPDRELEQQVYRDIQLLDPLIIEDVDGNRQGIAINIYWAENFESDDEHIEEVESQLSDITQQLLLDAANLGYKLIVFWR